MNPTFRYFLSGENALTIECADIISIEALTLVQKCLQALAKPPIPCVLEILPTYTTLTLLLDLNALAEAHKLANADEQDMRDTTIPDIFTPLISTIKQRLNLIDFFDLSQSGIAIGAERCIEIPVCYDSEFAPDLNDLAIQCGLAVQEVIRLHSEAHYRVAMIGFVPGFPYLLGLPKALALPRKTQPRTRIEAGSVGIAGEQTGVYPFATPGGWNIIGRTPRTLFYANNAVSPSLLSAGDIVRFRPISREEFYALRAEELRAYSHLPAKNPSDSEPSFSDSSPHICVVQSGFGVTVQDEGREPGTSSFRCYGVPGSGAADATTARLANILVGNTTDKAVLEIPFGQIEIYFPSETLIAITGNNVRVEAIAQASGAEMRCYSVGNLRPVLVSGATRLRLRGADTLRAYCAIGGGIDVPHVLGSRSTYLPAQFGGLGGRILHNNDILPISPHLSEENKRLIRYLEQHGRYSATHTEARWALAWQSSLSSNLSSETLRFFRGHEWNKCSEEMLQLLEYGEFHVQNTSNRMGVRLRPVQALSQAATRASIISRAVLPGAVQCTPDGTLIILLADAQTIGGYPVIAHICSVDIGRVAQLLAHETVRFRETRVEEAQKLYIDERRQISAHLARVRAMANSLR